MFNAVLALIATGVASFCCICSVQLTNPCITILYICCCWWSQIDLVKGMMDCLYAECTPCITDCVMAELEKLGQKYRVALKVAKVREPSTTT